MKCLFLSVILVLCATYWVAGDTSYDSQALPNVVLIVTDDQDVVLKGMVSLVILDSIPIV